MKIRIAQMEALSRHQFDSFVSRLERLLEEALPEYFFALPAEDRHALVSCLVGEARRYGITLESETGQYAQMRLEAGEAFSSALGDDAGFRGTLENSAVPGPHKLALIEEKFFSLR